MNKKEITILVIILVVSLLGIGGFLFYKSWLKAHEPNKDIENQVVVVPPSSIGEEMAIPSEPAYLYVSAESSSLYPNLDGTYEAIWDNFPSTSIDVLALGDEDFEASYKAIWAEKDLYIQVIVKDDSYDVSGATYDIQDSVEFYINEDGKKNKTLVVGDSHYAVNRENGRYDGFGADETFKSVVYELDGDKKGYVVEVQIPLLTITASQNDAIGFDIQVNNAKDGKLLSVKRWASINLKTAEDYSQVGKLQFTNSLEPVSKPNTESVAYSPKKIVIDGIIDTKWDEIEYTDILNVSWGTSGADGQYKTFWDKENLYILVGVHDETNDTSSERFSRQDCIEVFLNENGKKPSNYGQGDFHYKINREGVLECGNGGSEDLITYAVKGDSFGYVVEIALPFKTIEPEKDMVIGFDVRVNDAQGTGNRDYMVQWSDTSMYTYSNLEKIGNLILK